MPRTHKLTMKKAKKPTLVVESGCGLYAVEKILREEIREGKEHFLIKWKGYSSRENSWEPIENLSECPKLIEAFRESVKTSKVNKTDFARTDIMMSKTDAPKSTTTCTESQQAPITNPLLSDGFLRGLQPERIIGATHYANQLCFLMQWNDPRFKDLVTACEAKEKCPQIVIAYYESLICWQTNRSLAEMLAKDADAKGSEE